jgi:hypothetical protein
MAIGKLSVNHRRTVTRWTQFERLMLKLPSS